jgi:hypothetical protein
MQPHSSVHRLAALLLVDIALAGGQLTQTVNPTFITVTQCQKCEQRPNRHSSSRRMPVQVM